MPRKPKIFPIREAECKCGREMVVKYTCKQCGGYICAVCDTRYEGTCIVCAEDD